MSETGSSRVLLEQLAEDFVDRHRRGERPALNEYTERHPELAAAIRDLFPALVKIEALKPGSDDLTGPFAPHSVLAEGTRLERLGEYRILREVGRGGMGIVYEAEQESLGRHVALKVLPSGALLDAKQLGRFEREAKAAARLHHTNIVPVYGVGEADGLHYYVMQFIQGQGLDQVLGELRLLRRAGTPTDADAGRTPLSAAAQGLLTGQFDAAQAPPDEAPPLAWSQQQSGAIGSTTKVCLPGQPENAALSESGQHYYRGVARVGIQVAEALAHAHTQGTVHRDIKPSNLLLDAQGSVWVTDFGLAKAEDGSDLTGTGEVVGTLRYIPPERFAGQSDARGDVYALGLTLYELLTLRPAFDDAGRHLLIERILHEEPPRPRQIDAALPRDLETVVLKATAKDPTRRYQSAIDLADDLRRFVEDRPIQARRTTTRERLWRWCRRNPVVAGLTTAVVLLLVGVTAASVVLALNEKQAAQTEKGLREEAEEQRGKADWARQDAEGERGKADRARQDAEGVAKENRALLARQYVASGVRLLDEGNYAEALPWFIEALKKDAGNAEREAMHRRRIALVSQLCPRPDHLWFHPGPVAKAVFSPDGKRVVTVSGRDDKRNEARLWDATTGALIGEPMEHKAGVLHVAFRTGESASVASLRLSC